MVKISYTSALLALASCALVNSFSASASASDKRPNVAELLGKVPLRFEQNQGQLHPEAAYQARGAGYAIALDRQGGAWVHLETPSRDKASEFRIGLRHANSAPVIEPVDAEQTAFHYLRGADRSHWRSSIRAYGKVRYRDVYPGIDLVYYGNQRRLEYDLVVNPGADPRRVVMTLDGINEFHIDAQGDLLIETAVGEIRQHRPVIYQDGGARRYVNGRYVKRGPRELGFEIAAYDRTKPLIVDPVLTYSTFLGGTQDDGATAVAVDSAGNAYITGTTSSTNFAATTGTRQPRFAGTGGGGFIDSAGDAFVAKLNPSGTALVYWTYLGGSLKDLGWSIAVDGSGNVYVAGNTASTDFPVTDGAQQSRFAGKGGVTVFEGGDGFVAKLSPDGANLLYSTYLGGSADDRILGLAVDGSGNAYISGSTLSRNFPTTTGAFQTTFGGSTGDPRSSVPVGDAFIAKLNSAGKLTYSTYLGGKAEEAAMGLAIDSAGNAYVAGYTSSSDFPTTSGSFQTAYGGVRTQTVAGAGDAFVAKLNPAGSALVFSTFLGGAEEDMAWAITLDTAGNIYVGGRTFSAGFPTTEGVLRPTYGTASQSCAFVTKMNNNGRAPLLYSTFIGSCEQWDLIMGLKVDSTGAAHLAGVTKSRRYPVSADAAQPAFGGADVKPFWDFAGDGFYTRLDAKGAQILYSTYLGGNQGDLATGLAIDPDGKNVYIVGNASSTNFPVTRGVYQERMGGAASGFFPRGDAFALRISDAAVAPSPASVAAVGDTTGLTGTAGATLTNPLVVEVRDASKNALAGVTVNFTATNATVNPASAVTDAAGRASTRVTLGNTAGSATVTATVAGIAPVTFTIQVTQQGAGGGDNRPIVRSTLPVIQSFNGGTTMSSGTWIEVYGSNFAATTQEWAGSDFNGNTAPTQLAGVSVKVGGIAAYIRYVSPTQVNLQVPDFPATGPVQLQVTNANGTSDPMTVQKAKVSPGLLTTPAFNVNGKQYLAALHSDFVTFVGPVNLIPGVPFRPAAKDETIILLAVGCGPTTPATPAGQFFPDARPLASQVEVKFGATTASAQAFLAANTIGLCQLNVVTPNVASGDMTIDITVDGVGTGQTLYTTIE